MLSLRSAFRLVISSWSAPYLGTKMVATIGESFAAKAEARRQSSMKAMKAMQRVSWRHESQMLSLDVAASSAPSSVKHSQSVPFMASVIGDAEGAWLRSPRTWVQHAVEMPVILPGPRSNRGRFF